MLNNLLKKFIYIKLRYKALYLVVKFNNFEKKKNFFK